MRERNTLTFLIGPCLSGKSHYCEEKKSEDCIIVSSDAKRLELGITTYDPSTHGLVFAECKKDICKALKSGKDVIFDATNLNRRQRQEDINFYRNQFHNVNIKGIVFDVSRDTLHSRASSRKPTDVNFVSHDVIDKQFERLHWNYPTAADFDEFEILKEAKQQSLKNQIEETLKRKYGVDRDETNFSSYLNNDNIGRTGDSGLLDR
jgi:predicted kinase